LGSGRGEGWRKRNRRRIRRLLVEQSQVHAFLMGRLASRESRGTGEQENSRGKEVGWNRL
ncbi:unnamed protein product, partial [Heterotrigona itama]